VLSKRFAVAAVVSTLVLVGIGLAVAFTQPRGGSVVDDEEEKAVTRQRFTDLRILLADYSDPIAFSDPRSPQSKALTWLAYEDTTVKLEAVVGVGSAGGDDETSAAATAGDEASSADHHHLLQRYAIMVLFYACSGEDWRGFVTPLARQPDVHECDFFGFKCDGDGDRITEVNLDLQRLVGQLPDEIGLLTSLKKLYMAQNFLEGEIPGTIYDLTNLGTCCCTFRQDGR